MKQQIVKQFLEAGILLTPDSLDKITEKNAARLLEEASKEGSLVFSLKEEEQELLAEVRKFQKKQKFTTQELARYYSARFEGIKEMLEKKMEGVVSVSNSRKSLAPISTIGMVRERTHRGLIIEDTTGEAEVVTKSEEPQPDDVIGVKGHVKEGKIFADEIIWPDVPLNHISSRPSMQIILSEKDSHKGEFAITPEAVFGPDKRKAALPNPGWITIAKDSRRATVLVYSPGKAVSAKEAFGWLKRRHLSPEKTQIRSTDDPFLIEPIPDLVWIVMPGKKKEGGESISIPESWSESYKGVIIVASDGAQPAEVDMEKGEVLLKD
jgi:DNA polymerase II small subunit/DNA polymerase delta subunit B